MFLAVLSVAVIGLIIALPFVVNNDLRYRTGLELNLIPGKEAERLSDSDDGALLITVPLNNGNTDGPNPWLYRAQYIAWPTDSGVELENLESHERTAVPLERVEFTAGNADGSLLLLRGPLAGEAGEGAFTISYPDGEVTRLESAESLPDAPGDWETPTWEKTRGLCNRPSPGKTLVGCFRRSDAASYLAGDWELSVQMWGDYEEIYPLYRGQGFLPWIGFAENDTVLYAQNELGIVRIHIPERILEEAPPLTPYATPFASPVAMGGKCGGSLTVRWPLAV